jgi:hypothetical protein
MATTLDGYKLILECYHPASKNIEPYLFCDYLGTPELSIDAEGEGSVYADSRSLSKLGKLGGLYSRFRPIRLEVESRIFRRHHPADIPGQRSTVVQYPNQPASRPDGTEELVEHNVSLDENEPFTQLCVVINFVQPGPSRGIFRSSVTIADGVLRIWRRWLIERASREASTNWTGNDGDEKARTLWLDNRENVGLRLRIREKGSNAPLLERNEVSPVSYGMEYEGEI